ncbi:MAG: GxxExxY protein [Ferruginibacter sp.]
MKVSKEKLNEWGAIILDSSIAVHKELGPGLLESAYKSALMYELKWRGLKVRANVPVDFVYKYALLDKVYVLDLLVENEIIIEIKATEGLHPIFTAQLITYLKLYHRNLGYLINFNVPLLKDGFKRIVYNF